MAGPITHLVLAERVFDRHFPNMAKRDFFLGTSFPDIRYLKVIEREATHMEGLRVEDLQSDDAFTAGLKFHSIVDIARETFYNEVGLYTHCPASKFITQSVKILEDELFYDQLGDWAAVASMFNDIVPQEREFGIPDEALQKWHALLQKYVAERPTPNAVLAFAQALGFPDSVGHEMNESIAIMKENSTVLDFIHAFDTSFITLLS